EFVEKHHNALLKDLECDNCEKYCHPPFIKCKEDHLTCHACYEESDDCKLCGNNFYSETLDFFERAYEYLRHPCQNKKYGCDFIDTSRVVYDHQFFCSYEQDKCPNAECPWIGKQSEIFEHYRASHPKKLIIDRLDLQRIVEVEIVDGEINLRNIIQHQSQTFSVTIAISPSTGIVKLTSGNFRPFRWIHNFFARIIFPKINGGAWIRQDIFQFVSNCSCIASAETRTVRCDVIEEFKRSMNPNMHFEHFIEIRMLEYNPPSESSSDDEYDTEDDDDDEEDEDEDMDIHQRQILENEQRLVRLDPCI
ncbi:hypothetical protein HHI36_013641, partial [Cryptolaemus montrouzieri]